MPIGSFLRHFSHAHLSNAEGRNFDIDMNWLNYLGVMVFGIPHIWLRMRIRQILTILKTKDRNMQILNAGCGYGILDMELAQLGFNHLNLVDIDAKRINEIKRQSEEYPLFKNRLTSQVGSVTELPFEDNRFEWVVSSEVIEHIEDDALMMHELSRVLKPGGSILITTPADSKSNAKDFHTYGHTKAGYSLRELRSLGEQASLKLIGSHYYLYSIGKLCVRFHNLLHFKILIALFFYPLYLLTIIDTTLKIGEPNGVIAIFKK